MVFCFNSPLLFSSILLLLITVCWCLNVPIIPLAPNKMYANVSTRLCWEKDTDQLQTFEFDKYRLPNKLRL